MSNRKHKAIVTNEAPNKLRNGAVIAMGAIVALLAALGIVGANARGVAFAVGAGLAAAAGVIVAQMRRRQRRGASPAFRLDEDQVALAVLAVAALTAWRAASGGSVSPLAPLAYFLLGLWGLWAEKPGRIAMMAASAAAAVALAIGGGLAAFSFAALGSELVAVALFPQVGRLARRLEGGYRHRSPARLQRELLADLERDTKRLRLSPLPQEAPDDSTTHQERESHKALSSYFQIREATQDILHMIGLSQNAYTTLVLWIVDRDSARVKILEAYSAAEHLQKGEFTLRKGFLSGLIVGPGTTVRMRLDPYARRDLAYYRHEEPVSAILAVPIRQEGEGVGGYLILDRLDEAPFSDDEVSVAETAATQIMRIMVNETQLHRLDKSQREYYVLSEVSKALSQTLDRGSLMRVALDATRRIAPFDFAAIALMNGSDLAGQVVAVWPADMGIDGARFSGESNLIEWVVRNNQPLVYHDFENLPRRPPVFCRDEKLKNVASLLICPLRVKAEVRGAFVLLATEKQFFSEDLQHIFQIIANQIAVSMENADMYAQVEQMAITDPLTGLFNKRYFNERMDDILSRAERHDDELAVIMLDIDHFKTVNDTYGHPVGDQVLREVARTLKDSLRRIDVLARYGGEEFVLLLDATDAEKALKKAESLREAVAALQFKTEAGQSFDAHISLGLACFPGDGRQKEELIEKADIALYHSKKSGRNRATLYSSL